MLFKSLSLHLVLFGNCLSAARIEGRPRNLALLSTENTDFGELTIWGAPGGKVGHSATERDLGDSHLPLSAHEAEKEGQPQRRCGSNMVICGGADSAPNPDTCSRLIDYLIFSPTTQLGTDPRSLCLVVNGGQCCVSWASAVSGLVTGDLVRAAVSTYDRCANGPPTRFGLMREVNLKGKCTAQCLSNRPDGCQNE